MAQLLVDMGGAVAVLAVCKPFRGMWL